MYDEEFHRNLMLAKGLIAKVKRKKGMLNYLKQFFSIQITKVLLQIKIHTMLQFNLKDLIIKQIEAFNETNQFKSIYDSRHFSCSVQCMLNNNVI